MNNSDLRAFFDSLTDEEILSRVASGGLTDEALVIAREELRRRGVAEPGIAPPSKPEDEPYLGDWVLLEKGLSPTEAHILASCLQSSGIHADTGDTNLVQAYWLLSIAVGGARIRVPQAQLQQAREVLAAVRSGEFKLEEDFAGTDLAASPAESSERDSNGTAEATTAGGAMDDNSRARIGDAQSGPYRPPQAPVGDPGNVTRAERAVVLFRWLTGALVVQVATGTLLLVPEARAGDPGLVLMIAFLAGSIFFYALLCMLARRIGQNPVLWLTLGWLTLSVIAYFMMRARMRQVFSE